MFGRLPYALNVVCANFEDGISMVRVEFFHLPPEYASTCPLDGDVIVESVAAAMETVGGEGSALFFHTPGLTYVRT